MSLFSRQIIVILAVSGTLILGRIAAAKPTPGDALKLAPVQSDVDFDRPTGADVDKCTVDVESVGGITGWVVKTDSGQVLRRFLDTNGDNKVDQWCYYKDGIEVYRDIDANFNNKADQYRWLGTAGTRWGIDDDENLKIDSWKSLSAEEATAEVVGALRDKDNNRFLRVLLSEAELRTLGLAETQAKELAGKISAAKASFPEVAARQKLVTEKSEWIHFGATRPGLVPAGSGGNTKDLIVYDNVTTVVETSGKHSQIVIGTMIKLGDAWRVIDLPKNLGGEQTAASGVGYFFQASLATRPEIPESSPATSVSAEVQKLVSSLEKLDKSIATSTSRTEQARLNGERADLLEQLIQQANSPEDRTLWIRQYAETVSAAVQSGVFPDGVKRLELLQVSVSKLPAPGDLPAYIKFRHMTAAYNLSLQDKDVNFEKVNAAWMESLEQFVKDYSSSPDAAEAMLQLAIGSEFTGKDSQAVEWFGRIVREFPQSDLAAKAAGAKRRLESVGKPLSLKAKTLDGRQFDLAAMSGKVVLIHYWATWCEPCKQDMETIRALQAKYGTQGFSPIGVNVDHAAADTTAFVRSNKSLTWPQLFETGGLDSRLATELGILTLPTMLLVGRDGKVVSRNVHIGELDAELKKLLR
jgi:thiol-disulfide isomerase/thioredoxin